MNLDCEMNASSKGAGLKGQILYIAHVTHDNLLLPGRTF